MALVLQSYGSHRDPCCLDSCSSVFGEQKKPLIWWDTVRLDQLRMGRRLKVLLQ